MLEPLGPPFVTLEDLRLALRARAAALDVRGTPWIRLRDLRAVIAQKFWHRGRSKS